MTRSAHHPSLRRVLLVRHGETTGQSSIRFHGRTDVDLADEGAAQVAALAPRFVPTSIGRVVSSPMRRARASADVLMRELGGGHAVDVEPAFREFDFGRFEGLTAEEIEQEDPDWHRRWRAGDIQDWPEGDSLAGFHARVVVGWERVLATAVDGELLVVAHKGVLKVGLACLLGTDLAALRDWPMDLGSLTVCVRDGDVGSWRVADTNLTGSGHDSAPNPS